MAGDHGKFCWYELLTTDAKAAEAFYTAVVGWTTRDSGHPAIEYTLLNVGETGVGGLMALPKEASDAGARPGWLGYVAVDDVDACAETIAAKGGRIHKPGEDIPDVGRFAMVADPQGAAFVLFKALDGSAPPPPPPPATPGFVGWRELMAKDWTPAFDFYSELFGWTKDQAVDMGPMGTYQTFAVDGVQTGGMMTLPPGMEHPFWSYYFNVDAIGAAVERVKAAGGQVINGPMQVPGGSWIVQGIDPQGAMFCLVSPNG